MAPLRQMGEAAALMEVASQGAAHQLRRVILASGLPGVEEAVVGARTVLVRFDSVLTESEAVRLGELANDLTIGVPNDVPEPGEGLVEVPVAYDGPDLAEVADAVGMSTQEVARRHLAPTYTVAFMGFSPGFAYLSGLDPSLVVPRREVPRTRVPAGSVGIAGEHTCVYPQATPGGWQLLGHTSLVAFDAGRQPPSPFVPGRRVRFVHNPSTRDHPGSTLTPAPSTAGWGTLIVKRAGPLTTVQDRGRFGFAHLGVPRAGAVDLPGLELANALVGNSPRAAGLEATVLGPELSAGTATVIALSGGIVEATIDGEDVPMGWAVPLPAGSVLSVGPVTTGVRTYIGVAGGIAAAPVLGSRSADTLSGLGPAALRDGDRVPFGRPSARPARPKAIEPARSASYAGACELRVLLGPRDDWFTSEAVQALLSTEWRLTPACNRSGARLQGPLLARADPVAELLPEGMVPGAIQVPPDGQPIVLLANHPPTGGYPVIAVVHAADLPMIGQARPGEKVTFRL